MERNRDKKSRSEKIKATKLKFGLLQATLDEQGIVTIINRVGRKNYNVIQNFEIVKNYKQRRSARRFIERLSLSEH